MTSYASNQGLNFLDELTMYLNKTGEFPNLKLFHSDTANYQFAPGLGYQARARDAGSFIVVQDLTTALQALNEIIYQGEGIPEGEASGPYDDKAKLEKDHYDVFMDLMKEDYTWETYPIFKNNPVTSDYYCLDNRIYQVSYFPIFTYSL